MSDNARTRRTPRFASTGQRLFVLFVFAVLAYLIYLAVTGQYDAEVDRVAAWLHRQYEAIANRF